MIVFTAIVLVIVSLFGYIHWLQKYSRVAKLLDKFPSEGPYLPIAGHIWEYSRDLEKLFMHFRTRNASFSESFSSWSGPYYQMNIITAEDAEIILTNVKHIEKGVFYTIFERWLRTGLLTSSGEKWKQRRKMLTPAFHYNILQEFIEIFGEQSDKLVKVIKNECHKPKVDVKPILTMMTLSTICETSLGCELDQTNEHLTRYCDAMHCFADNFIERVTKPEIYADFTYVMHPSYWRERKIVKYLHKFTTDLIETRKMTFKIEDVINMDSNIQRSDKRLAMLDLLLHSKHFNEIDDAGIQEEVDTFVFEGHDTTTAASSFALMLLANHQDVQEKVVIELNEIFGDSDRHATYEDFQNMRYLDQCLKESLRIYPSVPTLARQINEDVQLTHHIAPSGSQITIHVWDIHRDPRYFPDPEKFDPERFSPESVIGRHPFAYIPFSAGPRNCIGQKFAMLELKSMVSSILRNFRIEPIDTPEKMVLSFDVVLRTRRPINVKFVPRK